MSCHQQSAAVDSLTHCGRVGIYNMLQTKKKVQNVQMLILTKTQKSVSGGPCDTFMKDKCIPDGHLVAREQHIKHLPWRSTTS